MSGAPDHTSAAAATGPLPHWTHAQQQIPAAQVRRLIEPSLRGLVSDGAWTVETVHAGHLLGWNRFDLAAKLLFLEDLKAGSPVHDDLYAEHIRLFTLGSFQEPGDRDKNSVEQYRETFVRLYEDMRDRGFDDTMSLVPLADDGTILNGAHRVACAIDLGLPVRCVRLPVPAQCYDYRFFQRRGASEHLLNRSALKFLECSRSTYFALIWPAAHGRTREIEAIIGRIVFQREVRLSWNACHNLVAEVYHGEEWLGARAENFPGATGKVAPCFSSQQPLRAYVFQADSIADVAEIKRRLRSLFDIDKHSVHINDQHAQALQMGHLLLNDNSIHFLQHGRPNRLQGAWRSVAAFVEFCVRNGIDTEDVALDSGIVLSLYGLRDCADVDYLARQHVPLAAASDGRINLHTETLPYHDHSVDALIRDTRLHFRYAGIKILAFQQVARMKQRRAEPKDLLDCRMMQSLVEGGRLRLLSLAAEQKLRFLSAKAVIHGITVLQTLGMYKFVRFFYRRWFK